MHEADSNMLSEEADELAKAISELETKLLKKPQDEAGILLQDTMKELLGELRRMESNMRRMIHKDETY